MGEAYYCASGVTLRVLAIALVGFRHNVARLPAWSIAFRALPSILGSILLFTWGAIELEPVVNRHLVAYLPAAANFHSFVAVAVGVLIPHVSWIKEAPL